MKNLLISMFYTASALLCVGAEAKNATSNSTATKIDREKFAAAVYRQTGGRIARPETNKGKIVCVNCQSEVPEATLAEASTTFRPLVMLPLEIERGKFTWPNPTISGNASLFVVDDESLPTLVSAPENRWAMVNIAPLRKGRGLEQAYFDARVKKEIVRGLALLAGAQNSTYPGSLMSCITDASQLDAFADSRLPVDVAKRFIPYIKGYSAIPAVEVTYKKACEEGWAPAPTNDVQKAIWDKVHALPTEPLKIRPETKKQDK